jgi:hypothetical protein
MAELADAADSKACGRRQASWPNPLLVLPFQTHPTTQRNGHRCGLCSLVVVCCDRIVTNRSRYALLMHSWQWSTTTPRLARKRIAVGGLPVIVPNFFEVPRRGCVESFVVPNAR